MAFPADQMLATTLSNYRKQLTDNIFGDRPLLWWLTQKNRVRFLSGGNDIVEPLIYGAGEQAAYAEWEQVDLTPQTGIGAAVFPWRMHYASVSISGLQEAQNNGKEAFINLLKAKIMQAEESLKDAFNSNCFSGNGTSPNWNGLATLIAASGTVGGIDPATYTWWASKADDTGEATLDASGIAQLRSLYFQASRGNDKPDALFSPYQEFEEYEQTLLANIRYEDTKSANNGFQNLMFKGAPWYPDADCTAETVYGLNSKYISMVGHKDNWMVQSGFMDGTATAHATSGLGAWVDAKYAVIKAYGNLTISNRARHFRLTVNA